MSWRSKSPRRPSGSSSGRDVHWELDLRVGGEILELDPPRTLVDTRTESSEREGSIENTVVRYELRPTAAGTRLGPAAWCLEL